jgi:hypothetical protein
MGLVERRSRLEEKDEIEQEREINRDTREKWIVFYSYHRSELDFW